MTERNRQTAFYQLTDEEAEAYLTARWGEGAITDLRLNYPYGPEPEVSGE